MHIVYLLLLAVLFQAQSEPIIIAPGSTIRGVIVNDDPVVHTDHLDKLNVQMQAMGKSFLLQITEADTYTVDMKAIQFVTYLVLCDLDGKVLTEKQGGLYAKHTRLVFEAAEHVQLEACALYDGLGPFELRFIQGEASEQNEPEMKTAALEEGQKLVKALEAGSIKETPSLAIVLGTIGDIYYYEEALEKAQPFYDRALQIQEKLLGPDHLETACCLFNLAYLFYCQGRYDKSLQLLERTLKIREESLDPYHADIVEVLEGMLPVLNDMGHFNEAKPIFERIVRIRTEVLGPEDEVTLGSQFHLADLLKNMGAYEDARTLLEHILSISEKALGPSHDNTLCILQSLSNLFYMQGNLKEATQLAEKLLKVHEQVRDAEHVDTAYCCLNLGIMLRDEARYAEARPLLERAFNIFEKTMGSDHPDTASATKELGVLFYDLRSYEEARRYLERALKIAEKALGPEHPNLAYYLGALGGVVEACGSYEEAKSLSRRTVEILNNAYGPDHPMTLTAFYNLADLLHNLEEYDEARIHAEQVLLMKEERYGLEHESLASVLHLLGGILSDQKEFTQARLFYERALKSYKKVYGSVHPKTITATQNLAHLLFTLGEREEAWDLSNNAYVSLTAHEQEQLPYLSEWERMSTVAWKITIIELAISIAGEMASAEKERSLYEMVLRWKGRASTSLVKSKARLHQASSTEKEALLSRIEQVQAELSKALFNQGQGDESLQAELTRLREERGRLEIELLRLGGEDKHEESPSSLNDLRTALPQRSAIVDFFIHRWYERIKDEAGELSIDLRLSQPHLSAWIVRKDRTDPIRLNLGPVEPILEAISAFLGSLVLEEPGRGLTPEKTISPDQGIDLNDQVRAMLWDPLKTHLEDADIVFISPDTFLGAFPFEVLQLQNGTCLIEHHSFLYLEDVESIPGMTKKHTECVDPVDAKIIPSLLAVGGVDYEERDGLTWQDSKGEKDTDPSFPPSEEAPDLLAIADTRGDHGLQWESLPGTARESIEIMQFHQSSFGGEGQRILLQGAAATEERLKSVLPKHSIAHIASHGFFQPDCLPDLRDQIRSEKESKGHRQAEVQQITGMLPGFLSGVVCAGANRESGAERDDGFLTAEELSWLDLSWVDLVVLSACETGLGTPRGGEGMAGLRRALRQAGVKTVISSLWSVKDESTCELMQNFYHRFWIQKQGKLEALRGAQLDMLEKNRIEHGQSMPSTWGAFVLDGDWR